MPSRIVWTIALLGALASSCHVMHHHGGHAPMSCGCCCDCGGRARGEHARLRRDDPRETREIEEDDEGEDSDDAARAAPGLTLAPGQSIHIEADGDGRTFELPWNGTFEIQDEPNSDAGESDEPRATEAPREDSGERAQLEAKIHDWLQAHPDAGRHTTVHPDDGAYLGVATEVVDGRLIVTEVMPNTAAATAGLQANDELKSFDGQATASAEALRELVGAKQPGDEIEMLVHRGDQEFSLKARLGSRAEPIVPLENARPLAPIRVQSTPPPTASADEIARLREDVATLRRELRELKQMLMQALAETHKGSGEQR